MKFQRFAPVILAAALAAALASPALSQEALKIGAPAPDFQLPNAEDGKPVALKDVLAKGKATVILFIATKCPVSNAYDSRMSEMGKAYTAKGISFVGINSNKTEPIVDVAKHAKAQGYVFPVLKDEGNKVADLYKAGRTPEVYVLDPKGNLVYHGRIDENQDDPKGVKSPDLKNALDAILAGKAVPVAETKAFGCTIKRV
ncbi:MAG: thioredoxin family protein [Acidobacteria bacterium]|nr:thioredoxin family protein [Acidobacteriota bacterium]